MPKLNDVLASLPQVLAKRGHEATWKYLGGLVSELEGKDQQLGMQPSAMALLRRAMDITKAPDPAGTLALMELCEERGGFNHKLRSLQATCFDRLGKHSEAKEATLKVVDDPNAEPVAVLVAANLLVRYNEQQKALDAALKAYEDLGRPLEHTATILYITQRCAAFAESDRLTDQINNAFIDGSLDRVNESPRTNLLWSSSEEMNIAVTTRWAQTALPKDHGRFNGVRSPIEGRKLRVGYLSSDFREHPTLRLLMGALRHHDPRSVEVILVCSGWDDGSPLRKEAEALASKVLSVADLNDVAAANAIREEGIDVLVELNGPTRANRMSILPYRPAPVQIDYLGWAGSVGGVGVDYVVGDWWTIPRGAERAYPEKVMRMDPTYQINDHRSFPSVEPLPRSSLGLPEDAIVFGVFNAINKIQGDVWSVWMQIMKYVPNSVLWILDPGDAARRRLGEFAVRAGIDTKRIIGAAARHQLDHLRRISAADIMLDPWPYGGHTSTSDALYAGVPVITINGLNFPGRVSAGLLRAAGLHSLVAKDPQDYANKAVSLARNPSALRGLKTLLRTATNTTCFDAKARTRQLEGLFIHAYQQWAKGAPLVHLNAPSLVPEQKVLFTGLPITVTHAGVGYGSKPKVTVGALSTSERPAANNTPKTEAHAKREVVLVCGPWSGGTSATAQVVEALGARLVGDMFQTRDDRTETYEMAAFRELLLDLSDEPSITRHADRETALKAFAAFDKQHFAGVSGPIVLKHPLSALYIDELEQVFSLKVITVMRSFKDIESTRLRRQWRPHFGRMGAEQIYLALSNALATSKSPMMWFKYNDLIQNPYRQVVEIANFLGFGMEKETLERAISRVRRK